MNLKLYFFKPILVAFIIFLNVGQFSAQRMMYSLSGYGGIYGKGRIVKYHPGEQTLETVKDFGTKQGTEGENPEFYEHTDHKLYSLSNFALSFGVSVFDPAENSYQAYPYRGLKTGTTSGKPVRGNNGLIYGIAHVSDGSSSQSAVFSFNPISHEVQITAYFPSEISAASTSLTLASDGKFYFSAFNSSRGALMCFNPDAAPNNAISVAALPQGDLILSEYSFETTGDLVELQPGKLYGTSSSGDYHCVFSYNLASNALVEEKRIYDNSGNLGQLCGITAGENGKAYIMSGGYYIDGTIIEYDHINNTFSASFNIFYSTWGTGAQGRLTKDNGIFYGITGGGGDAKPLLFKFDPSVQPQQEVEQLFEFVNSGPNGRKPTGTLTLHSNGKLYGRTTEGGYSSGTIFSFDPLTSEYQDVLLYNDPKNTNPRYLMEAGADGLLYGNLQGFEGSTSLYSIDPSNDQVEVLAEFPYDNNRRVYNSTPASNGKIYTTVLSNAVNEIYGFDPVAGNMEVVYSSGNFPQMTFLTPGDNGILFGNCTTSNQEYVTGVCKFDPESSEISLIHDFGQPFYNSQLKQHDDGKIYGVLTSLSGQTEFFSIDRISGEYELLYESTNINTFGLFCMGPDNTIYGFCDVNSSSSQTYKMYRFGLETHELTILNEFDYSYYGFIQSTPIFSTNNEMYIITSKSTITEPLIGYILIYKPETNTYETVEELGLRDYLTTGFIDIPDPSVIPECESGCCWHLFPNPASSEITLNSITATPLTIGIFNCDGSPVFTNNSPQSMETINIENLSPGIYLMRMEYTDAVITTPFIKL